jgi:hypothetical protein
MLLRLLLIDLDQRLVQWMLTTVHAWLRSSMIHPLTARTVAMGR